MCTQQGGERAAPYGYGVWLRQIESENACVAEGDGGQYIYVVPGRDLVVVMTQGNYLEWPLYRDQSEAIMRELLRALPEPAAS
jgi:CubicO group peptidase (beta-lactamase class C family)